MKMGLEESTRLAGAIGYRAAVVSAFDEDNEKNQLKESIRFT
jgi:hypothetical protein